QAEDGIRDKLVTGVQTCALPICDPRQLQTALSCLLRNAVEAALADGWARLRVEAASADRLRLVVEDSGPGPAPVQVEHLFDPFRSEERRVGKECRPRWPAEH